MLVKLRDGEVVVRDRADAQEQDVERRVLLGKAVREAGASVVLVGEEGVVPLTHGLGVGLARLGGRGGLIRLTACVGRHDGRAFGQDRLHPRHRHCAEEVDDREERHAHVTAHEEVAEEDEKAPAHHLHVDEVERELGHVEKREARDAALVGEDAVDARQPALRIEEHGSRGDAERTAQDAQPLRADGQQEPGHQERVAQKVELDVAEGCKRKGNDEVDVPDAEPREAGAGAVFNSGLHASYRPFGKIRRPSASNAKRPSSQPRP